MHTSSNTCHYVRHHVVREYTYTIIQKLTRGLARYISIENINDLFEVRMKEGVQISGKLYFIFTHFPSIQTSPKNANFVISYRALGM